MKEDVNVSPPPARERPGRQRKAPVVYTISEDESESDY